MINPCKTRIVPIVSFPLVLPPELSSGVPTPHPSFHIIARDKLITYFFVPLSKTENKSKPVERSNPNPKTRNLWMSWAHLSTGKTHLSSAARLGRWPTNQIMSSCAISDDRLTRCSSCSGLIQFLARSN